MDSLNVNKKIQKMILNVNISPDEVIRYVKGNCQNIALTPMTLGMLFEMYAEVHYNPKEPTSCFSKKRSPVAQH